MFYFILLTFYCGYIMVTHVASEVLPKPIVAYCKKCTVEHEKPVGTKCEWNKNVSKDTEKRDSSHEISSEKKHPKEKQLM